MQPTINVVIPAAGAARRMRSFGPKALIKVGGGETVILRQIRLVRERFPACRVFVVTGFQEDRMLRHLPDDVYLVPNHEFEDTNTAESVALGLAAAGDALPCLVVYGDVVFNRAALADIDPARSSVLVHDSPERAGEVGVALRGEDVTNFCHGLPSKWAHVALLGPVENRLFRLAARGKGHHLAYEILNAVIDQGGSFKAVTNPKMRLVEIDASKDVAAARKVVD